jgi:hypothetical protein
VTAPTSDPILGTCYIEPEAFISRSMAFGCDRALDALYAADADGTNLTALIASVSRAIDVYTGRDSNSWSGGTIYENHAWDPVTRRVKVNQPPVINLISYKIRVGSQLTANFVLTPLSSDGGSNHLAYGGVYYNRQENYLELNSLALAGSLTNSLAGLGLYLPQVEIAYTSFASVPGQVATATAIGAAAVVNKWYANKVITPGIKQIESGKQTIVKDSPLGSVNLPQEAKDLLSLLTRIAVG